MRRTLSRAGQLLGLGTAAMSLLLLGAVPASAAAPPANDTIAGATAISAVPFGETVDTTEATTDAEDAAINATCGAPATSGSIWYTLDAAAPAYLVDVSKSNFTAGVIVATGTPGNLSIVTCGPDAVGFEPTAGETYYLMAFSDSPDVVGGQLAIEVTETDPVPTISMTVDDAGSVDKATGVATISGTYTCDGTADFVVLQGSLQQEQGDVQVSGDFVQENLACGGTFDWSAEVTAESGGFKRGLAATAALTVGCNLLGCNIYDTLEVVRLRGGHG